ncbi:hypothetical protein QFC19_001087 [Naganishia cerealis]|uniref:Uncharacterized protein n=1 Tax=Naganishia cerealis TaxID=610337 RepID=A0ACC2WJX0_9TREE|nr:hypothetical protein QFC19_001087 [Naganishia cerealis]
MAKRLNKRQQRELEELRELEAAKIELSPQAEEELEENETESATQPVVAKKLNAFAALNAGNEGDEGAGEEGELSDSMDEEEDKSTAQKVCVNRTVVRSAHRPACPAPQSSKKKKKNKKKKKDTSKALAETELPSTRLERQLAAGKTKSKQTKKEAGDDDLDEVDKAIKELNLKYGDSSTSRNPSNLEEKDSVTFAKIRGLLSVDSKTLDPDAELKRFFGAKVVNSAQQSTDAKQARHAKMFEKHISRMRILFAKPKMTWPIMSSFGGLGMSALDESEVNDIRNVHQHAEEMSGANERWFTFEHDAGYRQIQLQFLGAIKSHDPNQLQALLSVYPWHIDTLLQMAAVYQQQGDIGAAADFCERAMFAFDRALMPGFSLNGTCRLDFDRVENRPLFLALHREVTHLAKRGLWQTAFGYAKILLSLDPHTDPHGSLLWLDFLAIKANNIAWLDQAAAAMDVSYLPGFAYNRALGMRIKAQGRDDTASDKALQEAILAFPQVILILADKAGFTVDQKVRSHSAFDMQVAYSNKQDISLHLMAHVYANRCAPLWKESSVANWMRAQVAIVADDLESGKRRLPATPVPVDEHNQTGNMPLWLIRHAYLSETYMGFMPPDVAAHMGHAFDPIPPFTAKTFYNDAYFNSRGSTTHRSAASHSNGLQDPNLAGIRDRLMNWVNQLGGDENNRRGFMYAITEALRDMLTTDEYANADPAQREAMDDMLLNQIMDDVLGGEEDEDEADMPGAFPQ